MPPALSGSPDILPALCRYCRVRRVRQTYPIISSKVQTGHIRIDFDDAGQIAISPSFTNHSHHQSASRHVSSTWERGQNRQQVQACCPQPSGIGRRHSVANGSLGSRDLMPQNLRQPQHYLSLKTSHSRTHVSPTSFWRKTHGGYRVADSPAMIRETFRPLHPLSPRSDLRSSIDTRTSSYHPYNRHALPRVYSSQSNALKLQRSAPQSDSLNVPSARQIHVSVRKAALATSTQSSSDEWHPSVVMGAASSSGIRAELRDWQINHAYEESKFRQIDFESGEDAQDVSGMADPDLEHLGEGGDEDMHGFEDHDRDGSAKKFLQVGDLVEIQDPKGDGEVTVAVLVHLHGALQSDLVQVFTMTGRWAHTQAYKIKNTIQRWAKPSEVEPLTKYLPTFDPEKGLGDLREAAFYHDLSVPRKVSAPLIRRMMQFHAESQAMYRRHANALDRAHDLLAHETDLRYGSVASAASMLLKIPEEKMPLAALWATRSALLRSGIAFHFDPASYRRTGFVQIRSKQQVSTIYRVRDWFRIWQNDMAKVSIMSESHLARHSTPKEAGYLYGFIKRAGNAVIESRKNREPTIQQAIGSSKKRLSITPGSDSVRITKNYEFTVEDADILRFIEMWANLGFLSDSRLRSLPPLLLQKTGLYQSNDKATQATGWMFLQEVGTILPYENPLRFDNDLLLPSSQQSKPLQNLMSSLLALRDSHDLKDSMASLRHDWKDLPVYCIDDASATEIDDGISVERDDLDADGNETHWIHVHVANPTAFFTRNHPIARMARHMTQSVYMPERVFAMLPRWVSNMFSLASNRPCLTFSVKLNQRGELLENIVRPGIIRNVMSLTSDEVNHILGEPVGPDSDALNVTIGGESRSSKRTHRSSPNITSRTVDDLETLFRLAESRVKRRKERGYMPTEGLNANVTVWQSWNSNGLPWEDIHRAGSRVVEGDPVIHLSVPRTFSDDLVSDRLRSRALVEEMMIVACEAAGLWCAERSMPTIYRGVKPRPESIDPAVWVRDNVEPLIGKDVSPQHWPRELVLNYKSNLGYNAYSSSRLPNPMGGTDAYIRATSPLRRYGDMICHWQIQALLLEEARVGRSLVTGRHDEVIDRPYLPFTSNSLEAMFVGLDAREDLINRVKKGASEFWIRMLLFRAIHCGDGTLPLPVVQVDSPPNSFEQHIHHIRPRYALPAGQFYSHHFFVTREPDPDKPDIVGVSCELNMVMKMHSPHLYGLQAAHLDDLWEVCIEYVGVQTRRAINRPLRLLKRNGVEVQESYGHTYVEGPPKASSNFSQTHLATSA